MKLFASVLAACLLTATAASADVQVTIHDGLVTVRARDATLRQIMAEWARVGQAKIVNAERIPGGPVTLELVNVPEVQALDTLLRSVAGYLAAPRADLTSNLSQFDRVMIMPTSTAPKTQPVAQAPTFQSPQFPPPVEDEPDDARASPNMPVAIPRNPTFGRFPSPQVINPQTGLPIIPSDPTGAPTEQQAPVYPSTPSSPFGGVAVPGMMTPTPQQQQPGVPGQIVQPPQPGQTRRPGGV